MNACACVRLEHEMTGCECMTPRHGRCAKDLWHEADDGGEHLGGLFVLALRVVHQP